MLTHSGSEFTAPLPDERPIEEPGIGDGSLALRAGPIVATATSYWTSEHRKQAAAKGWAMKDGSYPIKDAEDVRKAIQAIGRGGADKRAAIIRHIKKRAKALGVSKDVWQHLGKR